MAQFEIKLSSKNTNQPYYFVLKADNGQVIATSEMYTSKDGALNGIQSVKANASSAEVVIAYKEKPDTVVNYLNSIIGKM
ncbi:YegP family protein [Vibrio echinoideorum]|uniref:YegP family protein n=1 Tax=Vibrio echinoideorum TaxID=2100116 RepID=A0ABU9FW47_9VIBR